MAIKVTCTCGVVLNAGDADPGTDARCHACGQMLTMPRDLMPSHGVFVSHSNDDKTTADAVCNTLERSGIRCWIAPRDIMPGQDWSEAIIEAIDECRVMIVVFSSRSNHSHQVHREVERAVSKGLSVIPFRIEDVPMSKGMEYFLSSPHWLDALTTPLERHLQILSDAVKSLIRHEARPLAETQGAFVSQSSAAKERMGESRRGLTKKRRAVLAAAGCLLATLLVSMLAYPGWRLGNSGQAERSLEGGSAGDTSEVEPGSTPEVLPAGMERQGLPTTLIDTRRKPGEEVRSSERSRVPVRFVPDRPKAVHKSASFVLVSAEGLQLHRGYEPVVTVEKPFPAGPSTPGSAAPELTAFLEKVDANRDREYLVLLLQPSGVSAWESLQRCLVKNMPETLPEYDEFLPGAFRKIRKSRIDCVTEPFLPEWRLVQNSEDSQRIEYRPRWRLALDSPDDWFVVENRRVSFLDCRGIQSGFERAVSKMQKKDWLEVQRISYDLAGCDFRIEGTASPGSRPFELQAIRKPERFGESSEQIEGGRFKARLGQWGKGPKRPQLYFSVYPESYAFFRELRSMAWKADCEVTWTPMQSGEPMRFGRAYDIVARFR